MINNEKVVIHKIETVEVIRVIASKGEGTEKSPVMMVAQYWGKGGRYIGEMDANYLRDSDMS